MPMVESKCLNCGKTLLGYPSQRRRFCNHKCHKTYYNKVDNPTKNPETRAKISKTVKEYFSRMTKEEMKQKTPWYRKVGKANAKYVVRWVKANRSYLSAKRKKLYEEHPEMLVNRIMSKRHLNRMTNLERIVSSWLTELGVSWLWEEMIRTNKSWRFPDFSVPGTKLLIECDGSYWHKDIQKERLRDMELSDAGYIVLHLTEKEIKDESGRKTLSEFLAMNHVELQRPTISML